MIIIQQLTVILAERILSVAQPCEPQIPLPAQEDSGLPTTSQDESMINTQRVAQLGRSVGRTLRRWYLSIYKGEKSGPSRTTSRIDAERDSGD
jgi:hypothetical protein